MVGIDPAATSKSSYWPGAMPPVVAFHVTLDTMSLTGPSSVCTGLGRFWVWTVAVHPGTGRTSTVRRGKVVGK